MTIILFHGLGSSKKLLNYIYDGKTYNKNDFIKQLEKNHTVFIPNILYTNIHYYDEYTIMKPMFTPINNINYDDLSLDKFITKLYNSMDKKIYKAPYIVMGHSHGIYYACEFAKQYKKDIKCIISLDGSWITNELNKQRLITWKNKGKIIPKINNQKTLDDIIYKIKHEKDNSKYINMIETYVRAEHTKFCIKQKYEKINIPFITFRDFNLDVKDDIIMKQYNEMVLEENNILSKYNNHIIYILLDATHMIWLKSNYKNTIIKTIKLLEK
jgi:predicted esterase